MEAHPRIRDAADEAPDDSGQGIANCPTCGRGLTPDEPLFKCGQCGQWLCEAGERALSCTGWIYCPLCRTMARVEWLQSVPALAAT